MVPAQCPISNCVYILVTWPTAEPINITLHFKVDYGHVAGLNISIILFEVKLAIAINGSKTGF